MGVVFIEDFKNIPKKNPVPGERPAVLGIDHSIQ